MLQSLAAGLMLALAVSSAPALPHPAPPPPAPRITQGQARQMALLVARHDHVDLSDTHIEFNSMDMGADFIPGYASFIVIRESSTPGPDETLHRYAVNRRTGEVWEMTLCTHYSFPELTRMRHSLVGHAASPQQIAAEGRELGCSAHKSGATM